LARRALGLLLVAALVAAGCARQGAADRLPVGCTEGPGKVLDALRAAPRPVRLDGAPLSACLTRHSTGGDLQAVGPTLVSAATTLSDRAARDPEGRAALELGYLVGGLERGAEGPGGNTSGEVVRRVGLELDAVDNRSHALQKGLRAGRATG
jgi:hypothetical protein